MVQEQLVIRAALITPLILAGAGAFAQERITAGQFLDIADGHTLTFHDLHSGRAVGVEQFLTRKLSVWKETGGECVYGSITVDDGRLCFLYDHRDEKVCWWTFAEDDRLFVLYADRPTGEIQEIVDISDEPLGCPMKPSV